jgi:hypothetical protein
VQLTVVRRGGIAGVAVRATLDTAALAATERDAIEQAVQVLPFGEAAPPPSRPDAFRYEVTVTDAGRDRTAELPEGALPPALRGPLQAALAGGELE